MKLIQNIKLELVIKAVLLSVFVPLIVLTVSHLIIGLINGNVDTTPLN